MCVQAAVEIKHNDLFIIIYFWEYLGIPRSDSNERCPVKLIRPAQT